MENEQMLAGKCIRIGCLNPKGVGDRLFCTQDRVQWMFFCKVKGIESNPYIPEEQVEELVRAFAENKIFEHYKWAIKPKEQGENNDTDTNRGTEKKD